MSEAIHARNYRGARAPRGAREGVTGARRMPWRREPTKDAASRDSPRGGAHGLRSGGLRMGEPGGCGAATPPGNTYLVGREPGELKHLSTRRRRNQSRDPPSSGERKGAMAKPASACARQRSRRRGCGAGLPWSADQGACLGWGAERHGKAGRSGLEPRTRTQTEEADPDPRVGPGTGNPVRSRVDHHPSLNTPLRPIANKYREGKVKSTPGGE